MMGFVDNDCWDMVFMEGYLKKSGKKRAKQRYFVLHQHSSEWNTRLDCYDNEKSWKTNKPPRYTIYLVDVFNVSAVGGAKFPRTFGLYTNEQKIYLSARSEEEMQAWIDVISFNKVQEDSKRDESQKPAHSWSVKLRTGCHFEKENESVYAAVISASRVEFTQQNKVVFWIFIRNVLKHGFTENCSYLEVSEGGYEMTDGRECRDVNNALVDLGSGTVLLWIEFDDGEGAENFCSEILMYKKSLRKRSNTAETRPANRRLDFKRTMSHSDMLEVPPRLCENKDYSSKSNFSRSLSTACEEDSVFDVVNNNNSNNNDGEFRKVSGEYQPLSFSAVSDDGDNDATNLYGSPVSFSCYSIKDHLLNKASAGTSGHHKTSTSSCFGDDEQELNDNSARGHEHQTNEADIDNVFMKLKFDDFERNTSKEEDSKKRKKLNRHRANHETVISTNFRPKKTSTTEESQTNEGETNMDPVSLVGFKTSTHHFRQEPHYEAIREYGIKGALKSDRIHSNSSTPEGSPKMLHNRKYVLNTTPKTPSPKLSLKRFTPPLPKRNQSASLSDEKKSTSPTADNNNAKNYSNISFEKKSEAEPKYTDVDLKNIKNNHKKKRLFKSKVDHPYSEIIPKPRRFLNSSDLDVTSPVFPPLWNMTPPLPEDFRPNPLFSAAIIDGSKSDGDLSDSDVLDVPRYYNRRRSRTGTNDLPDPARFYEIPDQSQRPPRRPKQNYRVASYEKDYVLTAIKPRPSNGSNTSLKDISSRDSDSPNDSSATYENNALTLRASSSTDEDSESACDNEPAYENPNIRVVKPGGDIEQPTYENNELLASEIPPPEYATVSPNSSRLSRDTLSQSNESLDSSYNNVTFAQRSRQQLEYADIEINSHGHHYDNVSSPDDDAIDSSNRRFIKDNECYTEIDFKKTAGLKEALNQLRAGADTGSNLELNTDYKIDLSHIKFTKSGK